MNLQTPTAMFTCFGDTAEGGTAGGTTLVKSKFCQPHNL